MLIDSQQNVFNEEASNKKKTSAAKEAVEKTFVAHKSSIERSSPPSFKIEVNFVNHIKWVNLQTYNAIIDLAHKG